MGKQIERNHAQSVPRSDEGRSSLPDKVAVLLQSRIELLMFDVNYLATAALGLFVGNGKRGPMTFFVLVIGHEIDLVTVLVWIDLVELFVVVVLAVNKSDKVWSGLRT